MPDFSDFNFGQTETYLWADAFGPSFSDPVAEALFHEAYFVRDSSFDAEELSAIRHNLQAYLEDKYGIDFSDNFDWALWREAYESQAG